MATRDYVTSGAIRSDNQGIDNLFPLFLLPVDNEGSAANETPNLTAAFTTAIGDALKLDLSPEARGDLVRDVGAEDVFHYIYGVVHSPVYRSRFSEFLRTDLPRIPLTSDRELFRELCRLGGRLVELHLMEAANVSPITIYPVAGDNYVEKVRYTAPGQTAEQGRVWINAKQYFQGVPPEVWDFFVGGYQVCEKWLKDRKGRLLTYDDLTHYQSIAAALAETTALMREIDAVIEAHGGWPLS